MYICVYSYSCIYVYVYEHMYLRMCLWLWVYLHACNYTYILFSIAVYGSARLARPPDVTTKPNMLLTQHGQHLRVPADKQSPKSSDSKITAHPNCLRSAWSTIVRFSLCMLPRLRGIRTLGFGHVACLHPPKEYERKSDDFGSPILPVFPRSGGRGRGIQVKWGFPKIGTLRCL